MNKKVVALVLACVLIFSTIVAGTLAYLMDTTKTVKNTFTFGNVDIDLKESGTTDGDVLTKNFKLVPGQSYSKDPQVTVTKGSEDSWVFVKVEEANDLDTFVDYDVNTTTGEWTQVPGETNVYYREYTSSDVDVTYNVLTTGAVGANGQVTCKSGVTLNMIQAIDEENPPSLSFTAYAIQKDSALTTAALAWAEVNK